VPSRVVARAFVQALAAAERPELDELAELVDDVNAELASHGAAPGPNPFHRALRLAEPPRRRLPVRTRPRRRGAGRPAARRHASSRAGPDGDDLPPADVVAVPRAGR
jgi:hypothetical protein